MKQGMRVVPERPEMNEASFPDGSHCKGLQCGRLGSIPGLGRSPGEGNSYTLQYSGLENSMDREAWQVTWGSWGHKEPDRTEQLSLSAP